MARKPRQKLREPEPCHHCWAYYERKVRERRGKKLKCNVLENKMWDYSLHAGFNFGVVCGGSPIIEAPHPTDIIAPSDLEAFKAMLSDGIKSGRILT